jgi:hypothetical protein
MSTASGALFPQDQEHSDGTPYLIRIIRDVVLTFVRDWQRQPYKWGWEADFKCGIAGRLRQVFELTGHNEVRANYPDVVPGFQDKQLWSRVWCELSMEGAGCRCDVAVLDDIDDPDNPPRDPGKGTFPHLWLCEIKQDPYLAGIAADDIAKLQKLLEDGKTSFACSIAFHRRRAKSGTGIQWQEMERGRLWQRTAELPALERTSSDT